MSVHAAAAASMDLVTRTIFERGMIEAREDGEKKKTFWQKYKWMIIGGLAAMPIQIAGGWWYWRRRKAKKAAALKAEEEGRMGTYPTTQAQ